MRDVNWKLGGLFVLFIMVGNAHAGGFSPCADAGTIPALHGSLCAKESVPASYDSPPAMPARTATLFVRKFPSPGKARGSVWLVAGGPGESGASFYSMIDALQRSFPGLDLVIPDHRGTGYSSRLCPDEEAVGSPGGMALEAAEWGSCFGRLGSHPELASQFSITNSAHDLRLLIERNRNGKPVYVYGVSYGTQLVLRTLQLGKLPVTGVILDSLVPVETAPEWDLSRRSFVVDNIGRQVLKQCDANPDCHGMLGEPAEAAYRRLLARAAEDPAITADVPGKNLKRFFGTLLDIPAARDRIPYLIKALDERRGDELKSVLAELQRAFDSMGAYSQSPLSIPLVSIISASENNLRPTLTVAALQQENEQLLFTSGLPELMAAPALPLYGRDKYFSKLPAQLPPMLVVQGTLDPKTHYDGALSHVAALRSVGHVEMVSITNAPHFILWTAPACLEQAARAFVAGQRRPDRRCTLTTRATSSRQPPLRNLARLPR